MRSPSPDGLHHGDDAISLAYLEPLSTSADVQA